MQAGLLRMYLIHGLLVRYDVQAAVGDNCCCLRAAQCEEVLPALVGIEMPLIPVLAAMEATGIALSLDVLQQQRPPMIRRLQQLERAASELAGGVPFNLSAPSEGQHRLLFEKLKLPPPPQAVAG